MRRFGLRCGRGRPRMMRTIGLDLNVDYFKPVGVPMASLEEISLSAAEMEAMRLVELEGLEQEEAAKKMGVSRKTLWRELHAAHEKIADALVNGKAIQIMGCNEDLTSMSTTDQSKTSQLKGGK